MSRDHEKKSRRTAAWVRQGAIMLCLLLFVFFMGMFIRDMYRADKEDEANRQLRQQLRQAEALLAGNSSETQGGGSPEMQSGLLTGSESEDALGDDGMLKQYEGLWQQNNDLAGWLLIEGTDIDYPVMYTPEDPEFYLRRGFDGSYAVSGSLFIDGSCRPESNHVLIYGHKMRNGTMFGTLPEYASTDYAKEHSLIRFDTLGLQGSYQVLAAFYSRVYTDQDQDVFRYYQYADLSDPEVFEEYVRQAKEASLYDSGVDARYGDRLLTLSTCSSHTDNGRFVVVACEKGE